MNALTVLAKIKPGEEKQLSQTLAKIQESPGDNGIFHMTEDRRTHSSRWMITHHDDAGYRLLMVCEYDGDLSSYLEDLVAVTPGLDEIWGSCVGYSGKENFEKFVRAHYYETQAFYIAFRDETVESIRNKVAVRKKIEEFADDQFHVLKPILGVLERLPPRAGIVRALQRTYQSARTAFHNWWVNGFISILTPLTQLGQTKNYPLVPPFISIDEQRKLSKLDGQMTTITEVKPLRYPRLRIALALNEFLGKYGYAPGEFANVGTLHSFRWVLIDKGKRLIFISVFDGSWQNYMGDFIDKIIWALDGVYNNTRDYPPGGMREVNAFQSWILDHQYVPALLYQAYPTETVLNLIRDREINNDLSGRLWSAAHMDSDNIKPLLKAL